ncbi:MAG TPA: alanyl-tRNA editing protein [Bryobacteraceae bacterium]|nr:alanyl-tRNA editing protein [Bryobacteraceae bacterium]
MTERLYYHDCYLREFQARVIDRSQDGLRVYLDRTAFYPASGGQPFDLGTLGGVAVREVIDEEDRIAHLIEKPLAGEEVQGILDWNRRYDHMQQHTGQHLLSAVLEELFQIRTASFHLGPEVSNIDVEAPAITAGQLERAEERCAEIAAEARPVHITFEDASSGLELRKASTRTGTLRIVSIDQLDRSACGGTHVRTAAEIGLVLTGKLEKIRGTTRIEFVCGKRALRRARADHRLAASIGRALSVPPEQTPELIAGLIERNKSLEKTSQRLATELARREGQDLYAATAPGADGLRVALQRGSIDDAMRARAQAFVAGEKSVFLAVCDQPPSLLLAASNDSGIHAGERIKAAVAASGGRGGGNQQLGQGSVPDAAALARAEALLR